MDISVTRQKPGIGIIPYSSRNIPKGISGARTIGSPIHLPAFDKPDGIHWYALSERSGTGRKYQFAFFQGYHNNL
jgi:hypothetical protein